MRTFFIDSSMVWMIPFLEDGLQNGFKDVVVVI